MEQNYMNAGPMFFTSIDQIINWVIQLGFTTNEGELLKVLNETKKQGYEIQKPEPEPLTSEDFESVPEEAGCAGCVAVPTIGFTVYTGLDFRRRQIRHEEELRLLEIQKRKQK
jgi:hypothetical protein